MRFVLPITVTEKDISRAWILDDHERALRSAIAYAEDVPVRAVQVLPGVAYFFRPGTGRYKALLPGSVTEWLREFIRTGDAPEISFDLEFENPNWEIKQA